MPSLPEDLVILAVGAKPRGGPDNGKLPWRFRYGMRGAVLVALTLAGRVEIAGGQIAVRNASPLGDANLDEALAGLAAVREPSRHRRQLGGSRIFFKAEIPSRIVTSRPGQHRC